LSPLSFGNITSNDRSAENPAIGGLDRRNPNRDVNERAVFALPHRFIKRNRLLLPDFVEQSLGLFLPVSGDQPEDGFANDLLARIAIKSFGPCIPTGDDAC